MNKLLSMIVVLALAGCATTPDPQPTEPTIRTVEVMVDRPVPCPALAELGPEPSYPDTDEAIAEAATVAVLAQLYRAGRLLRDQRLAKYAAVAAGCNF